MPATSQTVPPYVVSVQDQKIAEIVYALADADEKLNTHGKEMLAVRFAQAFSELADSTDGMVRLEISAQPRTLPNAMGFENSEARRRQRAESEN